MREIKFRGKNENGWHYGLLTFMFNSYAISHVEDENTVDLIDEETIGQYTGLKDKKGVDIYEGDILTKKSFWPFYIGFENGCFVQIPCNKIKRKNRLEFSRINTYVKEFELVGNIYENPDLVEV